jgi:hypothetical protein
VAEPSARVEETLRVVGWHGRHGAPRGQLHEFEQPPSVGVGEECATVAVEPEDVERGEHDAAAWRLAAHPLRQRVSGRCGCERYAGHRR